MQILPPSPAAIDLAGNHLREGRLVVFPTETVYGLGADATNDRAVAAIFAAKARPVFNPLIIHISESGQVEGLIRLSREAESLMIRFWPGPLTLVLPRLENAPISLLCSAGLDTLAIRCPAHPVARQVIEAAGRPIAAPSANKSGRVSPTTPQHVADEFGDTPDIALLLAGGKCDVGLESTVLDLSGNTPTLLRPGAVLKEEIEAVLGHRIATSTGNAEAPNAPGQLTSHYAPRLPVRLDVTAPSAGEALLAFGPGWPKAMLNLSESGDLSEAAANLFAGLRQLDRPEYSAICVAPIPETGLGIAINDRLKRAAAGR